MSTIRRLLIANRGEIAIRVARAARALGITTVSVYSQDDRTSLHVGATDESAALQGVGPQAYLNSQALVAAAKASGCDAVHPGYGFLSENAGFARACAAESLIFVGPDPATLEIFGDKAQARALAERLGAPVAAATSGDATLDEVRSFQAGLQGADIMIKAVAGGGGRGMRRVGAGEDPSAAFELCAREATAAFGDSRLMAERYMTDARHIEVQVLGDGTDAVAIHDRECSLQRRNQKIIEVAPAPNISTAVRERLVRSALALAGATGVRGLTTFEFLLDGESLIFIEANPRLQVEHTVTEAVTGLDLVQLQLQVAGGASLADLGLSDGPPPPVGYAIELRVNLETLAADGAISSGAGAVISHYEPPGGPGVRVDGYGFGGYRTNPSFDSLIAKVIVHSPSPEFSVAVTKAAQAAAEFRLSGPAHNLGLLRAILERPEVVAARATTDFIERNLPALVARAQALSASAPVIVMATEVGRQSSAETAPAGSEPSPAPLRATVVGFEVSTGDIVRAGQAVAVLEAMKMQHVVPAAHAGIVRRLVGQIGDVVEEGAALVFIEPGDQGAHVDVQQIIDLDLIRPDLAAVISRHALTLDDNRPEAVARRRKTGQRTARENLGDLFDPGSFNEFGALAIAAQKRRRSLEDLQLNTPADGIITGVGEVNGTLFEPDKSRCVALAYDFTVLAGTQGFFSHKKTDRILEFAEHWRAPIVWFTEGGGGRPGDVDVSTGASSLDTTSFTTFARLSGVAPRIAINSGRCFAGNAVFFGCADITIGTRYSNIGLGGPAMVEGGGLGVFTPDEIGPSDVQWKNGVLDLLVDDEAAAVAATKQLLSCFQGALKAWTFPDQRKLRHLIPENRVRVYDVRAVIETLADHGSWIEMRGGYGAGMLTGFLRIEGRPMGVIANDPRLLGGAIDGDGAEKAGRFMQLCDAFDVPILSLCDTPGFMVGPDSEKTAAVRRGSRMFVAAGALGVPLFTVVLRKGYGLGAQAMAGGDFSAAAMMLAWPTAEFGPMGLEGAVRLGYRKELDAEPDPAARQAMFEKRLARMYQQGMAMAVAEVLEIDAVIDPSETRSWLVRGLKACPIDRSRARRGFVDVW